MAERLVKLRLVGPLVGWVQDLIRHTCARDWHLYKHSVSHHQHVTNKHAQRRLV